MKNSKESSVASNGIGGAIAIVVVVIANKFGADLTGEQGALIVGAFGTIITFFLPALGAKRE